MKNKKNYFYTSKKQSLYYTEVSTKSRITVFFLHGLMSNISGKKVKYLKSLCKKNKINFLAFDYSGHGKSSGVFEHQGINDWINEALEICKSKLNNKKIILIGSSCGSWIAARLIWKIKNIIGFIGISSAPDFTKYLMWNTFSRKTKNLIKSGKIYKLKNNYEGFYPIGKNLINGGNKNLILKKRKICNFPLRFFHGLKDDIVPIEYSYLLSKSLIAKDSLIFIQNSGDHSLSSKSDLKRIGKELIRIVQA
ncbi:MAG: alpha/beta hydrolase [Candidatus Pelagibacter sp.]|nr:alpha/beta hydrolase [Candidatus Pelagibacter sp.]OUV87949.1 MAG: alpha/beta hydrolase [Pelagibacteraceae bacterium TMED136]|tara:strand:- start:3438 stop:4190 length:753 start_codon:yes stop_codon:yes gene_type:complete